LFYPQNRKMPGGQRFPGQRVFEARPARAIQKRFPSIKILFFHTIFKVRFAKLRSEGFSGDLG